VWVNITYSYIQEDMFQYSFSEGITWMTDFCITLCMLWRHVEGVVG
jgi:hypothetical protein